MNVQFEALEKELATLQTRAADLDAEYSRAVTKRDAAQEALICGTGTTTTATQAATTVQALDDARTEVAKRIANKQREIATANAAAERARKIEELKAATKEYDAKRENFSKMQKFSQKLLTSKFRRFWTA